MSQYTTATRGLEVLGKTLTDLISLVVDAICQRVGPHTDIQVSVTEPLHSLLHVGDCPQSNLKQESETHLNET